MKKYYNITFKWYDTNTYCSNIAYAETEEDVKESYSKYEIIAISEAKDYDVEDAKRRGKPIVNC